MVRNYARKTDRQNWFSENMERAVEADITGQLGYKRASDTFSPLDVAFTKPLGLYYDEEAKKWLRTNPGKVVTLFEISELFGEAFFSSANMRTAINGFEKTGIWPVFTDTDLLPSQTTSIEVEGTNTISAENLQFISNTAESQQTLDRNDDPCSINLIENFGPNLAEIQCSPEKYSELIHNQDTTDLQPLQDITNIENFQITSDIEPAPGCSRMPDTFADHTQQSKTAFMSVRKRGKTAILALSPYKAELQEIVKRVEKAKRAKVEKIKQTGERKSIKKTAKKNKGIQKKTKNLDINNSSPEHEDTACLYCNKLYSKSIEGWCSCANCKKWAHLSCAGLDSDDVESVHLCELCTQ
ncbi:hypothetical protein ILUMI_21627 [Ignelater luminosus]|uniref:Zinc finger PHD-type domain-containing protein n=1 Tax=Ignelater luminosus TaxID=2038154 RepID=A0A8K0FXU0_IGNLU|nr:hypothetical protein ILUMI_21627 [Ignelater luminosus]